MYVTVSHTLLVISFFIPPISFSAIFKVAHLAEVEDNTIAWVLSWHLMSEMDCVITKTTAKAKEVHAATGGSQQVLPIDSIFTKNLPNWIR